MFREKDLHSDGAKPTNQVSRSTPAEASFPRDNRDSQMYEGGHARLNTGCGVHGILCSSSQKGLQEKEEDIAVIGGPLLRVKFCVCVY
jgi:hypothetical protein